ncbi:hypothetical protein [Persephonella sp.]|uniref:hypothetical protein n=1 Tax=Persephonella sp. TaxID=2060922 RepID=UPI0025D363D1|nr:hypothetical protein [Persephonella sp.]
MDEKNQIEILKELKRELRAFQKYCLLPLKIFSKRCKNYILDSLFINGEVNKSVRNEEVFTEGIKNFLRKRGKFLPVNNPREEGIDQKKQKIDLLLKYKDKKNILLLLEIKKIRENNPNGKIAQKINGKTYYIEGTYFQMQDNYIETLVIKIDNKYYNLDKIGESQVVAYKYNMEFNEKNNVIPAVYYLDKNELWYIEKLEKVNSSNFILKCKDNNNLKRFEDTNLEVFKVIAKNLIQTV